jgi:preprotein translocase subunit SecA
MQIFAKPSAEIPLGAKLYDLPQDLAAKIPYVEDFKYVVDQNKVVLVDPVNGTVAAVIEK